MQGGLWDGMYMCVCVSVRVIACRHTTTAAPTFLTGQVKLRADGKVYNAVDYTAFGRYEIHADFMVQGRERLIGMLWERGLASPMIHVQLTVACAKTRDAKYCCTV